MKKLKSIIKKNKKTEYLSTHGITLVSLVFTIVILIILAGISLNLTIGENGLFTMSKKAKENIELAQIEEQTRMNELYDEMEQEGYYENPSVDELEENKKQLETQVASLSTQVAELKTEYDNILSRLDALDGGRKSSVSVDNLNSKLPTFNTIYENQNVSSSTTFSCTGVSCTIPANSYYSVTASAINKTGAAELVGISSSSTSLSLLSTSGVGYNGNAVCNINNFTDSEITLYVWASYDKQAITNNIKLQGYYVTLPK